MGKKLLSILASIVIVLIAIPIFWTIQDSASNAEIALLNRCLVLIAIYIVDGIIFGAITDYLAKTKGYEKGFAWGFWLGPIGLLVVGFRPTLKQTVKQASAPVQKFDEVEVLTKLAKLHEQGILTDEEYQQKKQDILAKM